MARHKAVVVGAGGIARAWFPRLIDQKVDVVGVVDLDVKRAQGRVDEYGVDAAVGDDLRDMLARTQPDFVVDLTVPAAHCEVTCTALQAGCHVIGEKPMANSMAEARKMVRTAEKAGKIYVVSQNRRFVDYHLRIRRTVDKGLLGTLNTLDCDFYLGPRFGGFRDAMESPLILDMSIHHFDLARYLIGKDPVAVYCQEYNPAGSWYAGDVAAMCIFEMTDGVMFGYRGSWCADGFRTSWHGDWRIVGERGSLLYERDEEPRIDVVKQPDTRNVPKTSVKKPAAGKLRQLNQAGPLAELLKYLRTGETPSTECHDNIKSLAMVFAAMESSRKGRRVPVKAM